MTSMVDRARLFAIAAHGAIGQKRKYTNEPYYIHCFNVVRIMMSVGIQSNFGLAAAWLHDTVEDTALTIQDIEDEFGAKVAMLVSEVTDVSKPEHGNRKQRKELDRCHLAVASPMGKSIKLADIIDNTATIVKYDPKFAQVYMKEKKALLEVLQEGNPFLYQQASQLVRDYFKNVT
jgi:(p)ppGpp synthase/HD superfamily hydrolase